MIQNSSRSAIVTPNEEERLSKLKELKILDTEPEQALDDITLIAAQITGMPRRQSSAWLTGIVSGSSLASAPALKRLRETSPSVLMPSTKQSLW